MVDFGTVQYPSPVFRVEAVTLRQPGRQRARACDRRLSRRPIYGGKLRRPICSCARISDGARVDADVEASAKVRERIEGTGGGDRERASSIQTEEVDAGLAAGTDVGPYVDFRERRQTGNSRSGAWPQAREHEWGDAQPRVPAECFELEAGWNQ